MEPIKCPEAGENAIMVVTIPDFEALQGMHGKNYYSHVLSMLEMNDLDVIKSTSRILLKGGDADKLLSSAPLEKVAHYCLDAFSMAVHGITFAALTERLENEMVKRAARDARIAAAVEAAKNGTA